MRHPRSAIAIAVLMLAACGGDGDRAGRPSPPPDGVDAEEAEPVEPREIGPERDLFGLGFEGLWRFEQHTEVLLVLDPAAAAADLAEELRARDGVAAVEELDASALEDRAALEALLPPDTPAPAALLVTAGDHGTALSLGALVPRDEVAHALVPTCDALAGTARLHGAERARTLLDAAGCNRIVIVAANADVDTPWVAAAGIDEGTVCIAATYQDGASARSSSTCSQTPEEPGMPVASLAGGFVVGFAPPDAATVELEAGDQEATVEPVTVADEAARAYAAYLPGPDADALLGGARDIADITWRFLDADGVVVEQG